MHNLRQIGGGAGILAGVAAAWLLVGLTLVLPAAGLGPSAQHDPHKYLTFVTKHPILFWTVNIFGGLAAPLLALVLLLALADRFREVAPERSLIGIALGAVGMTVLAIGAAVRLIGLGSLGSLYATNKTGAAYVFYALHGTANSFAALGDVAFGLAVLVFGNVMLGTRLYGRVGYLSVLTGSPLVLAAFVPDETLFLTVSVLTTAWLIWTGVLLWSEAGPYVERAAAGWRGPVAEWVAGGGTKARP